MNILMQMNKCKLQAWQINMMMQMNKCNQMLLQMIINDQLFLQ